jgi:hypothetical protein
MKAGVAAFVDEPAMVMPPMLSSLVVTLSGVKCVLQHAPRRSDATLGGICRILGLLAILICGHVFVGNAFSTVAYWDAVREVLSSGLTRFNADWGRITPRLRGFTERNNAQQRTCGDCIGLSVSCQHWKCQRQYHAKRKLAPVNVELSPLMVMLLVPVWFEVMTSEPLTVVCVRSEMRARPGWQVL